MSKLVWDSIGEKTYETGVSKAVLYPVVGAAYPKGVAWNGVTGITESPSGAEATKLYANNGVYLSLYSAEDLGVTLTAYMYPDEFKECDGSSELTTGVTAGQQERKAFGLSYQTIIGSDTDGNSYGYKIHLIYGCKASPSERAYTTVNDSPEANEFSWELTTTPVSVTGKKSTAILTIDSTKVDKDALAAFEDILYGAESAEARLPLPDEVTDFFKTFTKTPETHNVG